MLALSGIGPAQAATPLARVAVQRHRLVIPRRHGPPNDRGTDLTEAGGWL